MSTVRPPAVAGMFYPADPRELARDVRELLAGARPQNLIPKAIIAPHAGYIYSGAVAASAYATLLNPYPSPQPSDGTTSHSTRLANNASQVAGYPARGERVAARIRRVVLLGPTHRVAVRGLALPGVEAFDTPLGRVPLDTEAAQAIAALPQVTVSPQAHALEHSLEVHLPFLQSVLPDFKLLPLAVGMATSEEVAGVLEALWGGDETLIVVSSDLSHFLPYAAAQHVDGATVRAILDLREPLDHEQACGATPVGGLLVAARRHRLTPHLLDLRNSGDTAGSHDRVVGYASIAFTEGV